MPQGRPARPAPDEQVPGAGHLDYPAPPHVRRDRHGVAVAHGAAAGWIDALDGARHLLRDRIVELRVAEPTACHDVVEGAARAQRVGEPPEPRVRLGA